MKGIGTRASFLRPHGQQETLLHRELSSLSSVSDDQRRLSATSYYSSHSGGTLVPEDERSICRSASNLSEDKFQQTSYGSIVYQIKEVEQEATDLWDFIIRLLEVAWDSLLVTALMILLLAMPISMLAVGSSYQHECPREPRIPIYLLVGGGFGTLYLLLLLWQQKKSRDSKYLTDDADDDDDDMEDGVMTRSCRFTCYMLSAFLLVWFVLGNVWVLGLWTPNFSQPLHDPQNWCHRVVFFFAFYQLLVVYGLVGLLLFIFFCLIIAFLIRRSCTEQ